MLVDADKFQMRRKRQGLPDDPAAKRASRLVKPAAAANMEAMPHPSTWLKVLPSGLFCEPGGFYIDPLRPVDRAVITHGHSDHARPWHRAVLATADTLAVMRARLGDGAGASQQALGWHDPITLGDMRVWLSPAGHVLGSAQ